MTIVAHAGGGITTTTVNEAFLLPTGAVLLTCADASAHLLEPDEGGSYVNGAIRRVGDMPWTHLYSPAMLTNDGRLHILPGEFGTSHAGDDNAVSTFDCRTGQWSSHVETGADSIISTHTDNAFVMTDDGRMVGRTWVVPASGDITAITPSANQDAVSIIEEGMCLLPNGQVVGIAGWTRNLSGARSALRRRDVAYGSEFVAAGSVSRTERTQIISGSISSNNVGYWRLAGDTLSRVVSGGEYEYESGVVMWMPKIGKVVLAAGHGAIYELDGMGNGNAVRVADPLLEPDDANHRTSRTIGRVRSTNNGQTIATALASGAISFDTTDAVLTASQITDGFTSSFGVVTKNFYVCVDGNSKWIKGTYTAATVDGSVITLTGCAVANVNPGATAVALATGDRVTVARPSYETRDGCGCILPNGDLMFTSGNERLKNIDGFNDSCVLLKWDGESATPTLIETDGSARIPGVDFQSTLLPLPDGTVLIVSSQTSIGNLRFYVPTTEEATPTVDARPVVTSIPARVDQNASFTLSGTQLNGLHEGAAQNDDRTPRTNFPIVRMTHIATGRVVTCGTRDWTYRGIQPNRPSSCTVDVPDSIPPGPYQLTVVASGVSSESVAVVVAPAPIGETIFFPHQ